MRNTKQKQIINSVIEQLFHFTSDDLISKVNEIDSTIKTAIKQVAMTNNVDTVVEQSVVFFGGVDLTEKVIKALNGR